MQTYSWERNVRQLENVIARAVVDYPGMEVDETALERLFLKQGDEVRPEFLLASPPETTRAVRTGMTEEESILQAMRAPQNLMKNGRPNLSRVARALRMDRHTLPRKLLQYRIDKVSLDGE
jgi:DNA-binding NtrC family response regulator